MACPFDGSRSGSGCAVRPAMSIPIVALSIGVAGLVGPFSAVADDSPACRYASGPNVVLIDANNGNFLSSNRNFPAGNAVELRFVNKNPYVYDYRYTIDGQSVDAARIRLFLEKVGLGEFTAPASADTEVDDSDPNMRLRQCPHIDEDQMNLAANVASDRRELAAGLSSDIRTLNSKTRSFDELVDEIERTLPTDIRTCEDLRDDGNRLVSLIDDIARVAAKLEQTAANLASQKQRLNEAISARDISNSESVAACENALNTVTALVDALDKNIADANDTRAALRTMADTLQQTRELIDEVHRLPTAFVDTRRIGPVDEAVDFSIAVRRTQKSDRDQETSADAGVVRLGRPMFSYSLGASLAFSDLAEYGRAASVSETGAVVNIVEELDSSKLQWGLVGQLNASIGEVGRGWSWGWSLGIALSEESEATDLTLYTGPFLKLSQRWFVTAAVYANEGTKLGGGFSVGDEIPDDFTGEVPTRSETEAALMLTMTYDFQ